MWPQEGGSEFIRDDQATVDWKDRPRACHSSGQTTQSQASYMGFGFSQQTGRLS